MRTHRIIYLTGVAQIKNLIPHRTHREIIVPLLNEAHQLEIDKLEKASKAITRHIKRCYGSYFTDESPLFKAIESGVLELPSQQGGAQAITILAL